MSQRKLKVGIKRNCSANNTSIDVEVVVPDELKFDPNHHEIKQRIKPFVESQYPHIHKPCQPGEFDVMFVMDGGKIKEPKRTTITSNTSISSSKKGGSFLLGLPWYLAIILFPFVAIWWILKLIWKLVTPLLK